MNARHRKTLQAVFAEPVSASIKWRDIEALLNALGAEIREAAGSRVLVTLNGVKTVFHRPHPRPEAKRYAIRDLRDFLARAGIDHGTL